MSDELALLRTVADMGLLIDARDWEAAVGLFGESVAVDYTSLNGGEPATTSPAELVGGWRQRLEPLDATHHLIANLSARIDGERATCTANVTATHVKANATGGPHWTVGGRYDVGLVDTADGWRITALTLTVRWASGNQAIMG